MNYSHLFQLHADEEIKLLFRSHWIAVFKLVIIGLALAVVPVVAYFLIGGIATLSFETAFSQALVTICLSSYYLFVLMFVFAGYIDYYLDIWVVTNQRVISIEQNGLFARDVATHDLDKMQDIMAQVKGFWATVFNYGDVLVQTAAEQGRFSFDQIPKPKEAAEQIIKLVDAYNEAHEAPRPPKGGGETKR